MLQLVLVLHVLVAVAILVLVLVQQGQGAYAGAAFGGGGGASNSVFGSKGSAPFMVKLTAFFALIFFMTSIGIGFLSAHNSHVAKQVTLDMPTTKVASAPLQKKAIKKVATKQKSV